MKKSIVSTLVALTTVAMVASPAFAATKTPAKTTTAHHQVAAKKTAKPVQKTTKPVQKTTKPIKKATKSIKKVTVKASSKANTHKTSSKNSKGKTSTKKSTK